MHARSKIRGEWQCTLTKLCFQHEYEALNSITNSERLLYRKGLYMRLCRRDMPSAPQRPDRVSWMTKTMCLHDKAMTLRQYLQALAVEGKSTGEAGAT
jgi:hypothetical protein